jgi:hypothetical protein
VGRVAPELVLPADVFSARHSKSAAPASHEGTKHTKDTLPMTFFVMLRDIRIFVVTV